MNVKISNQQALVAFRRRVQARKVAAVERCGVERGVQIGNQSAMDVTCHREKGHEGEHRGITLDSDDNAITYRWTASRKVASKSEWLDLIDLNGLVEGGRIQWEDPADPSRGYVGDIQPSRGGFYASVMIGSGGGNLVRSEGQTFPTLSRAKEWVEQRLSGFKYEAAHKTAKGAPVLPWGMRQNPAIPGPEKVVYTAEWGDLELRVWSTGVNSRVQWYWGATSVYGGHVGGGFGLLPSTPDQSDLYDTPAEAQVAAEAFAQEFRGHTLSSRKTASGECPYCGLWGCSPTCPGPTTWGVCPKCGAGTSDGRCDDPQGCGWGWEGSDRGLTFDGEPRIVWGSRKQGATEPENIQLARKVLAEGFYSAGGVLDQFSASAIVQVYDALNGENKAKFGNLPLLKMVEIAFKLAKGASRRVASDFSSHPWSNPGQGPAIIKALDQLPESASGQEVVDILGAAFATSGGTPDTFDREAVFMAAAHKTGLPYDDIYYAWLYSPDNFGEPRSAARKTVGASDALDQAIIEHAKSPSGTINVGDVIDGKTITEVGTHTIQYTEGGWSGSRQIPWIGPHGERYPAYDRALEAL